MIAEFLMFQLWLAAIIATLLIARFLYKVTHLNKYLIPTYDDFTEWINTFLLIYLGRMLIDEFRESIPIIFIQIQKKWETSFLRKVLIYFQPIAKEFGDICNKLVYLVFWLIPYKFGGILLINYFSKRYESIASFFRKIYKWSPDFWWYLLTLLIVILWNLGLFFLYKFGSSFIAIYGWGFVTGFFILGVKNIKLILLKALGKAFGFLIGNLIRRSEKLVDWIKGRRTVVEKEFTSFRSSFKNPKIIDKIYFVPQLWAWGTLLITGLLGVRFINVKRKRAGISFQVLAVINREI